MATNKIKKIANSMFFDITKKTDGDIPSYSFMLAEETSFLISDTVIKSKRFKNETDLKSVSFSSSLKTIESNVFENCTELKEIYWEKFAPAKNKQIIIEVSKDSVKIGNETEIKFLENETGKEKIEIKNLKGNNTQSETVENTASAFLTLQSNSFFHCTKLHTVLLPPRENVVIEKSAFEGCTSLRTVLILCNHAQINENAFAGCDNVVFVSNCDDVLSFARNRGLEYVDVR